MSLAGLSQYVKNLNTLMDSDAYKNGNEAERVTLTMRFLSSKFGKGHFMGFGSIKPLNPAKTDNEAT